MAELRSISQRMLGFSPKLAPCEEFIMRKNNITLVSHQEHIDRLEEELEEHKRLVANLEQDVLLGPTIDRSRARKRLIKFRYTPLIPDPMGNEGQAPQAPRGGPPGPPPPPGSGPGSSSTSSHQPQSDSTSAPSSKKRRRSSNQEA